MSHFMRHGLGDCTTESHCGCRAEVHDRGLAMILDAELRRLAEAATPGPWWHEWVGGDDWWAVYGQPTGGMVRPEVCTTWGSDESAYIAAANPAVVLGLLDATDALRAELAHMCEARDNARAEVERLTAIVNSDVFEATRGGVDADSLFPEQPITPSELGAEA